VPAYGGPKRLDLAHGLMAWVDPALEQQIRDVAQALDWPDHLG
jgi:hypothetical protein